MAGGTPANPAALAPEGSMPSPGTSRPPDWELGVLGKPFTSYEPLRNPRRLGGLNHGCTQI
jgi:hypothetical protein